VLIVDDDPAISVMISAAVADHGYHVIAAADGRQAMDALERDTPDVILLDVRLPDVSGYHLCHEVRERFGDSVGVMLISGERRESYDRAGGLLLGADDYLVKPFALDELLARIARLVPRRAAIARSVADRLTPREREILSCLSSGLDHVAIAAQLVIAPKTVEKHIEHILVKLDVHSRAQAIALAMNEGAMADAGPTAQVTRFEDLRRRDAVGG
jgi:DNA-binding NarL/FixJ family response regulator